ncbi:thiamine phosphate synthase [Rhodovulum adriaticum]|uniref:Thiamine-phosphate synthase n=1 Tax=Rhodovulum adriaticum TaxID=35804 RepID=A0A4R2NL09_RHOAD|nr:thiamine phosphate synthase [Rhodovulum adriaticum]MBK1635180.1 thiamine phosphate synthase [Rhodovulum adriaticum]TCP22293.1 thiamine-phosphate diphosphorylase [Rhodovulum adriaticum]
MNLSVYFVTPDGADDALVLAALRGGATAIQLRDKTATDAEMTAQARRLIPHLTAVGVPLIVNDRVEVARAAGAAGLHIGQGDGDPRAARAAIGPDRILGLSVEEAAHLTAMPPGVVDYVGLGPVRATATKPDHAAPIGLDGLARLTAAAPVPAVAIGGVNAADIPAIKGCGCAGIAVVSAISAAPDPLAATRALATAWSTA